MKVSVLDYAVIDEGETVSQALAHTIQLAQKAEALGYQRFWMAEHHNVPAFASSSPEVIMMQLLNHTQHIRIGSGGIMLPHYSPYKVVENFKVMEAYFPGRIDLGVGNNMGTPIVRKALERASDKIPSYEADLRQVYDYLTQSEDEQTKILANPQVEDLPAMWLLSTSVRRAKWAAEAGCAYVYGIFPYAREDALEVGRQAIVTYRKHFKASQLLQEPKAMFSAFVATADQEEEAEDLTRSLDLWLLGQDQFSYYQRMPSIKTAKATEITNQMAEKIKSNRTRMLHGKASQVASQLKDWINYLDADEALIMPLVPGIDKRMQTLELLAHYLGTK
ncbi:MULTISPECIES: LLM class flavin-dependent oxidoreductase [Aerococcus]|uniref:LLM class flavin-dependent oxidoreductase n=1 Tax=Aerococcus TaxID=1375 RepID=UPI000DCE546B|nr:MULTISPECIES: LLM class flavin-dependent oxidoreductase [Aerococcus]KAA9232229.1 LLM class flavin-dependent oxidoreductase [Aerococcus mictus]MBU5611072.1 LLM class flavin-dependent oxidoreductase [Aerococcus urinae]MDK6291721.1 LLM class flavin-dependent oxidoreductase [Aerococcus urinae]MDK6376080.1 LLM class flavin-dependent oxidoreductase [Aerococcus urinae]MDK6421697.1 LLM class flavin-dependent oxidoreductase [Aerococcus urinae]